MGYTRGEIIDFVEELGRSTSDTEFRDDTTIKKELWRIRQERVPVALSGGPGCDWRTFRDEADRFQRPATRSGPADESDYWQLPNLPLSTDWSSESGDADQDHSRFKS